MKESKVLFDQRTGKKMLEVRTMNDHVSGFIKSWTFKNPSLIRHQHRQYFTYTEK